MQSSSIVSNDILEIGTRQYDLQKKRSAAVASSVGKTGGTAGLCPPELVLGMPGAFDLPNVPDVSIMKISVSVIDWYTPNRVVCDFFVFGWNYITIIHITCPCYFVFLDPNSNMENMLFVASTLL